MTQREFAETVVEAYNTGNPKILEPILFGFRRAQKGVCVSVSPLVRLG